MERRQGIDMDCQYKLTETDLCRQFGITKHIYVKLVNMKDPGLLVSTDSHNTCCNTSAKFKSTPNLTTINNTAFPKPRAVLFPATTVIKGELTSTTSAAITNSKTILASARPTVLANSSIARALIRATETETENADDAYNSEITDKPACESKTRTPGPADCQHRVHDYNNGTETESTSGIEIESETVNEIESRQSMISQTVFDCADRNCNFFTQFRSLLDEHVTLKHTTSRPTKKRRSGGSERKRRRRSENSKSTRNRNRTARPTTEESIQVSPAGFTKENNSNNNCCVKKRRSRPRKKSVTKKSKLNSDIDTPYSDIISAGPYQTIRAISNHVIAVAPLITALLNADTRLQSSTPFSAATTTETTEGVQTSKPVSAIVVKKRRGRPRKNIVEENSSICTLCSSSNSNINITTTNACASSSKPAEKNQLNGSFKNRIAVINSANTIALCPAPGKETETHIKGSNAKLKNKAKAKNFKKKTNPIKNTGNNQTSAPLCPTGKGRSKQGKTRKQMQLSRHFCTHPNCGFKSRKSEKMENHANEVHSSSTSSATETAVAVTVSVPAKRKSKKTTVLRDFGGGIMSDQLKPRPRPSYKESEQDVSESESEDEFYERQMQNFKEVSDIWKLPTSSETEIISEIGHVAELSLSTFPVTDFDPNIDPVTDLHHNIGPLTDPGPDSNIDPVIESGSAPNIEAISDPSPDSNIDQVTDQGPYAYIHPVTDPDPEYNIDPVTCSVPAPNMDPVTDPDPGCCPTSEIKADTVYQSCKNENGLKTNNKEPPPVAGTLQSKNNVNLDEENDDFPKVVSVCSTSFVSGPVAGLALEVLTETFPGPVSPPPPPTPPLIDLTLSSPEPFTEEENELNESENVVYDAPLDLIDKTDFLSRIAADAGMDLQSILCDAPAPTQSASHMAVDTERYEGSYSKKQERTEPSQSQPLGKSTLFQPWLDTPSPMQMPIQPPPLSPYLGPEPQPEQQPQLTSATPVSFPPHNNVFNCNYNRSYGSSAGFGDKSDGNLGSHSICLGQQFHSHCIHPHPTTVLMTNIEAQTPLCQSQNMHIIQQSNQQQHQLTQQYYPVNLLHNAWCQYCQCHCPYK